MYELYSRPNGEVDAGQPNCGISCELQHDVSSEKIRDGRVRTYLVERVQCLTVDLVACVKGDGTDVRQPADTEDAVNKTYIPIKATKRQ